MTDLWRTRRNINPPACHINIQPIYNWEQKPGTNYKLGLDQKNEDTAASASSHSPPAAPPSPRSRRYDPDSQCAIFWSIVHAFQALTTPRTVPEKEGVKHKRMAMMLCGSKLVMTEKTEKKRHSHY